ncbi:MAG: TadE/TadG family type IV pilus assembly protein [Pseudomonadota bacterium]
MARIDRDRLKRSLADQRGATAVIYALTLLPIVLMLGFTLDFRRAVSAKAHMQEALDAAVLSGALEHSEALFESEAERMRRVRERLDATFALDLNGRGGTSLTGESVSFQVADDGMIVGTADASLPMFFGGLFGRPDIDLSVTSSAQAAPQQRLEIVLALDNTTSMFRQSRFNLMRSAAKNFVNDLFDEVAGPDLTSIGIVPWATLVNINSERPGGFDPGPAANRSVGADGSRRRPNNAFENRLRYLYAPESEQAYTQVAMDRDFAPVTWRGCVRAAPNERQVSSGGNVSRPLTDDPVSGMRWHAAFLEPELETVRIDADDDDDDLIADAGIAIPAGRALRCTQRAERGSGNIHIDVSRPCAERNGEEADERIDACVSDPNEFDYFRRGGRACPWQEDIFPWTRARAISGPNQNCPVSMLGLSQDRAQIIDKLDEMHPATGGTHMDLGLMWGLRILSPQPRWARFFGQDQPSSYTDPSVRKVLILLSDGENVAPGPFEGYYGCTEGDTRGAAGPCWRADGINRLSAGALNALTADACDAIRGYGIEVFTIAVDVDSSEALSLLEDCAGNAERAYNIRASEIDAVFQSIARQELRLTR